MKKSSFLDSVMSNIVDRATDYFLGFWTTERATIDGIAAGKNRELRKRADKTIDSLPEILLLEE